MNNDFNNILNNNTANGLENNEIELPVVKSSIEAVDLSEVELPAVKEDTDGIINLSSKYDETVTSKVKRVLKSSDTSRLKIKLIISFSLLLVLVGLLITTILYSTNPFLGKSESIEYSKFEVKYSDFSDKSSNFNSLRYGMSVIVNNNFYDLNDYYLKGIDVTNTVVEKFGENYLLYTNSYSDESFVSKIGPDGKIKWIKLFDDKTFAIKSVKEYNNIYYLVGMSNENISIYTVDSNGKILKSKVISEEVGLKYLDFFVYENGMGIAFLDDHSKLFVYMYDDNFNIKDKYSMSEGITDLDEHVGFITSLSRQTLSLIISAFSTSQSYYLVNFDPVNLVWNYKYISDNYDEMIELNRLDVGLYSERNNLINYYDDSYNLLHTFDYTNIELEELHTEYTDVDLYDTFGNKITVDDLDNELVINNFKKVGELYLVRFSTRTLIGYDIYDNNFKPVKRYLLNKNKYKYMGSRHISTFYANNKIVEFYQSYGDAPSIFINIFE